MGRKEGFTRPLCLLGEGERRNEIRISNRATYWTVAPLDMLVAAPLMGRFLLGATPLGRLLQGVVLGMYLGSGLRDWSDRQGIRRIDFRREFGADVGHMRAMPREIREAEVRTLARRLNDEVILERIPRRELAVEAGRRCLHKGPKALWAAIR